MSALVCSPRSFQNFTRRSSPREASRFPLGLQASAVSCASCATTVLTRVTCGVEPEACARASSPVIAIVPSIARIRAGPSAAVLRRRVISEVIVEARCAMVVPNLNAPPPASCWRQRDGVMRRPSHKHDFSNMVDAGKIWGYQDSVWMTW